MASEGRAGYYQYHAVPGNTGQLRVFRRRVCRLWRSVLVRRSQRARVSWDRLNPLLNQWIPHPHVPVAISDGRPYRDNYEIVSQLLKKLDSAY